MQFGRGRQGRGPVLAWPEGECTSRPTCALSAGDFQLCTGDKAQCPQTVTLEGGCLLAPATQVSEGAWFLCTAWPVGIHVSALW